MKRLLFLLPLIILFSCEEQILIPDLPKCKECTTTIIYSSGEKQTNTDFICDPVALSKRENLNFTTTEGNEIVIYKTSCYVPNCKVK